MPTTILALDQGTTSSRALLFDASGKILALAQREYTQIYPRPGWVEHDPREIWQTQLETARRAIDDAGITPADIAAIGITNQRETTVLWDRATGEPLHNAIVWQDRRTASFCEQLRADGHADLFQQRTGLVLDAYFSGTKLRWLLDHVEGARARAEAGELCFGTIDCWLVYNLTGGQVHATDASNASRTLMLDIHRGCWDDELLAILDVPPACLPTVVPSSGPVGETTLFGGSIPIAGIAGDQQSALFGQLCTRPGMVKTTYGTGCFMLMHTGDRPVRSNHQLLTTIAWQRGDHIEYALEGSVFIGGAVVSWLRDGLSIIDSSAEIEPLARSVEDSGGVILVPAFAGLGAPHWDPHARGAILGLTSGSTRAHVARAALESIAFQVADLVEAMQDDAGLTIDQMRVDGGASVNDLLMADQANLLRRPVIRPANTETTALGAAYLAGLAVDVWPSTDALADQWQIDATFAPSTDDVSSRQALWRRAVDRVRDWA